MFAGKMKLHDCKGGILPIVLVFLHSVGLIVTSLYIFECCMQNSCKRVKKFNMVMVTSYLISGQGLQICNVD